jgi:hypothetical protein
MLKFIQITGRYTEASRWCFYTMVGEREDSYYDDDFEEDIYETWWELEGGEDGDSQVDIVPENEEFETIKIKVA